ncbi:MAG: hypothetical protein RL347_1977 [Actinomycetota bacterium]
MIPQAGRRRWLTLASASAGAAILLAACSAIPSSSQPDPSQADPSQPTAQTSSAAAVAPASGGMDADGIVTVGLSEPYTPASEGTATDDYRCFLLDTGVPEDRFITGVRFVPDNAAVVHHAILYRVRAEQIVGAQVRDEEDPGQGWSCFGGPDLPSVGGDAVRSLDSAPWLAAWAPGGREARYPEGTGVFLEKGSSVILQVHYNLLAGDGPDNTSVKLRTVPGDSDLRPLETMLFPGPVELPCLPEESGPLCDREAAVEDTIERFGGESLRTIWGLQLICDGDLVNPRAGATQSCTHRVSEPVTVFASAGHMHLLGREISLVANAGTPQEMTLLDIDEWDFDNQGARPLPEPIDLDRGDTITVTCTHDAKLRSLLPALAGTEPRYITWGEGTTDEMCLGILTVAPRG